MSLRFFSDHCVPTEIIESLCGRGHEVTCLRTVLPTSSLDEVVLAKAQELNAILLTLNGDFADIVAYPPGKYGGIVAIQLHNHPETIPALMDGLHAFLTANPEPTFYLGKLIIVEPHRIRIRV